MQHPININEEEKYKSLFEQLKRVQEAGKVGYWAVYEEKEHLEWSAETYKLFDIPNGTPVTYHDMLTYVYPDDKVWVDKMWQKAMKGGEYKVIYRIISAKKKLKWIETYGDITFDDTGKFKHALGITRDITEEKEAELKLEALASLLERTQKIVKLGSWNLNAGNETFETNKETNLMFGFPIDHTISIEDWQAKIHPDDQGHVWENWTRAIEGNSNYEIEYRIIVKNTIRWVTAVGEIEFDPQGKFTKILGAVRDVTERYTRQDELRLAKEQAEAANKLKSAFLANMSHEIRTPLNGIVGFSELLIQSELDATQKLYMNTVNQSAHRLIGIVNDILDFSKIEVGKLQLAIEKVDLYALADQVTNIIGYQAKEKNIKVYIKIDTDVPQYVLADELRLQQVLINLLGNAAKFTENGEIELNIQILEDNKYRFGVRDTGIGISAENQTKIFDAFNQEDFSTTKKFGGTGLGLSISNGILSLMNSRLQLKSESGKGSLFYFDLVLDKFEIKELDLESPDSSIEPQEEVPNDNDFKSLNLKILVVEDYAVNMLLTKVIIRKLLPNATIIEALDGKIAVSEFEKHKPDLVLMDIQMPILNGYDATKQIRKLEIKSNSIEDTSQHTPILAVTAGILEGDKAKCLAAGMDDFIGKPIMIDSFTQMIKKWIGRSRN